MNAGYKDSACVTSADGFSPAFPTDSGYPLIASRPIWTPAFSTASPWAALISRPRMAKPGTMYEWGLQLQQQLAQDLILEVGYMGNKAQNFVRSAEYQQTFLRAHSVWAIV